MWVKLLKPYSKQDLSHPDRPWVDHEVGEVLEINHNPDNLIKWGGAVKWHEPPVKKPKTKKGKKNGNSDK